LALERPKLFRLMVETIGPKREQRHSRRHDVAIAAQYRVSFV
jgi:hypothetical protein